MPPRGSKSASKSKKSEDVVKTKQGKSNALNIQVGLAEKKRAAATEAPVDKPVSKRAKQQKPQPVFSRLDSNQDNYTPVEVFYEGDNEVSMLSPTGGFVHSLKLEAPGLFSVLRTIGFPEDSELAGHQAIIIRPAKPFPFMKLSEGARQLVYKWYFSPNNIPGGKIMVEGRRSSNKEIFAKLYSEGSKNRLALLAVCKQINAEALGIMYAHPLRFETTASLLDFLSQSSGDVRQALRTIEVKAYSKTSARVALHFLAEARNLATLRVEQGMPAADAADPTKAAKAFYADAFKLLEAVGAARGNKGAAVDMLDFGEHAFATGTGDAKEPWAAELVADFREKLRTRLNEP